MLHAFLPHKFIDHTHATAVLSVIDQPDGEKKCAEVFAGRLAFVPYVMPGFGLAKKAIEVFERTKPSDGLILGKHGIFTFGASAREAYERMIEMVTLAENFIASRRKSARCGYRAAQIMPARRGCADPSRRLQRKRTRKSTAHGDGLFSNSAPATPCSNFVSRGDLARMQPAWRGNTGPYHPHQELAAALAARRKPASSLTLPALRAMPRGNSSRATIAISRSTTSASATSSTSSIRCPASCWCRDSACSASAAASGTP